MAGDGTADLWVRHRNIEFGWEIKQVKHTLVSTLVLAVFFLLGCNVISVDAEVEEAFIANGGAEIVPEKDSSTSAGIEQDAIGTFAGSIFSLNHGERLFSFEYNADLMEKGTQPHAFYRDDLGSKERSQSFRLNVESQSSDYIAKAREALEGRFYGWISEMESHEETRILHSSIGEDKFHVISVAYDPFYEEDVVRHWIVFEHVVSEDGQSESAILHSEIRISYFESEHRIWNQEVEQIRNSFEVLLQ